MIKIQNQHTAIAWMVSISMLILFACSSLRHALFKSTALDLAVFDQWVYLASIGKPPISSLLGFHLLGDHAALILYAIALLYKIIPNVHWLFAVQAIALSLGALPIYALSLQSRLSPIYARAVALSYLLYPALFNSNFFTDFRPESIAVPGLLWAIWAGIAGKTWQLIAAVVLVLSCKEILSLTVIGLGIWFWLVAGKRLYGWGCIVLGTVWFIATIGYLVPMLRGGQAGGVVFYATLGNSPSEILSNIFTNPSLIFSKFFLRDTVFYYFLLVAPVIIGLRWQQVMILLPALPMLLLNILSDYSAQRDLVHHYSLTIFPFIIVWLLCSIHQYQQRKERPWLTSKLLITWSLIAFLALAKYGYFWSRYLDTLDTLEATREAVSQVQTKGGVLTTATIAPHLAHRELIELTNADLPPADLTKYDYVLLNLRHPGWLNNRDFVTGLISQLKDNQKFNLQYQRDDVFLFIKRF
ncbi:DUF2079 domain-containing protein [Rivularia sp. UHCC 0363]|uniref:DUF2079 domain-containing protein n=1 Tax=Rivularia sp. UHCC 0363 TaxID=3110244 RepID=UPI002B1EAB19|nr:DUF2079 domain-containing protein [Rivularia sp. UHCC 0363]MEA5593941.1 DUF2079 domain-containing protein [Rivularia sp. UHCC 0363]